MVIQGKRAGDESVVGIRYFKGGEGACLLRELEFGDESETLLNDK